jgi:prefoldin subunit 5
MAVVGFILWSAACVAIGALWAKSKAKKINPAIDLSLGGLAEEDAKEALAYLKQKVEELKAKQR